jgi:RNA polymerase sigma-70 factor (ECF subfamily)
MNPGPTRLRQIAVSRKREEVHTSSHEPSPSVTPLEDLPDERLVELLKTGKSNSALAVLFSRYRHLVFSVSTKILRDRTEAEDVVQDVFLEIYRKASLFDPTRGNVKAWILQYAYSRSFDRRRYLSLRNLTGSESNGNGRPRGHEPRCSDDGLERLALERRIGKIKKALEALTDRQKVALKLVGFEGLLLKEAAEEMDESVTNIRNYYYRGLKKLREMLVDVSVQNGLK